MPRTAKDAATALLRYGGEGRPDPEGTTNATIAQECHSCLPQRFPHS
jgi:hypothetical protein